MPRRTHARQKSLQELLRQTRLAAGLHQKDVAARLRRPQSFVSKYETGERRLDLIELLEICQVLGVKLSDFARRFEDAAR